MRKPAPGWKHLGGSVWEHVSGIRLHTLGTARLPDGKFIDAGTYPESIRAQRAIRIAGNRKRGLMIWALQVREDSQWQSQQGR